MICLFIIGEASGMICGMSYQQLKAHIPGKENVFLFLFISAAFLYIRILFIFNNFLNRKFDIEFKKDKQNEDA